MGRDRSRSRDRRKSSRDKSRSRDRKRSAERSSRSVDRKKPPRDRSRSRDRRSRSRDYRRRDRSRSRDKKRDRRHKSRSSERRNKDKKREHSRERRRDRSTSRSRRHRRSSSSSEHRDNSTHKQQKVKILSLEEVKQQKRRADDASSHEYDLRKSFHISDEFSQEGFEQFTLDHGIDLATIETEEERSTVHEKMEEILKAHFAAQGKVYPPPKVEKPAVNVQTGFANDGSFLEQFKKLQDDKKKQEEDEKKRKALELRLKTLPIRRRAGGKILKTGIVAKAKVVKPSDNTPGDSFSSYMKEVQKYKTTACDNDSKTRPLVK